MKIQNFNDFLALVALAGILGIVAFTVVRQLGGNEILALIIGHITAWGEMIILFYFRKKSGESSK